MKIERQALLAVALSSLCAAILLGETNSRAASSPELPNTLRAVSTPLPTVTVRHDPFISFVVPHATMTTSPSGNQTASAPGASTVINAPPGYVPNPGNGANPNVPPQATQNLVILCDTWTVPPAAQADFTPTAVFLVGNTSLIAVAGETVGGYRIRDIKPDSVTFETGEHLGFGDCRPINEVGAQSGTDEDNASPQIAPALNAENEPQTRPTPLSNLNGSPTSLTAPPRSTAPLPSTSGSDTSSAMRPYGQSSTGSYGSSVYGASVPQQSQGVSPFGILQYPGTPH